MRSLFLAIVTATLAFTATAQEPLPGFFIALEACQAFQSKNLMTNPGDVLTRAMQAYPMIGVNEPNGEFYLISMATAPVATARWVHVSCGLHVVDLGAAASKGDAAPGVVTPTASAESVDNVLAISWQPAFCETRPDKAECRSLNAGDLPITQTRFSIHGLWPQPHGDAYCGVPEALRQLDEAGRWSDLPSVGVDAETRLALDVAMPGTASLLERHEWIKHGTCYRARGGADEYYDDTLHLLSAINESPVAEFMANNVGRQIATADLRTLFDDAFGQGAGKRVQFHCTGDGGRMLIQELRVSLHGRIEPDTDLGDLLLAADPVPPGCGWGVVDSAGLQ